MNFVPIFNDFFILFSKPINSQEGAVLISNSTGSDSQIVLIMLDTNHFLSTFVHIKTWCTVNALKATSRICIFHSLYIYGVYFCNCIFVFLYITDCTMYMYVSEMNSFNSFNTGHLCGVEVIIVIYVLPK